MLKQPLVVSTGNLYNTVTGTECCHLITWNAWSRTFMSGSPDIMLMEWYSFPAILKLYHSSPQKPLWSRSSHFLCQMTLPPTNCEPRLLWTRITLGFSVFLDIYMSVHECLIFQKYKPPCWLVYVYMCIYLNHCRSIYIYTARSVNFYTK